MVFSLKLFKGPICCTKLFHSIYFLLSRKLKLQNNKKVANKEII